MTIELFPLPILLLFIASLLAISLAKFSAKRIAWMLAVAPFAAFCWLFLTIPDVSKGEIATWQLNWMPSLGLSFGFYLDGLSLLFGLLVTGIGTLIVLYAGYYFAHEEGTNRFFCYLFLFMTAMLGLVLAGDVITLFLFWEGTSITSFLLVAYKYKYESAQKGAFRALLVTGGGGIALLVGLLGVSYLANGTDWQTILASDITGETGYAVVFAFIALGAFTKSAQMPFHFWLPGAMSAPTPASAYLHSATMVKAGVYLLARLYPAMGGSDIWMYTLSFVGATTMMLAAIIGFKQNDLKALLAYSTISQLGALVWLAGQQTDKAFKALVIGILVHALYKSALFMMAGIVDHETGTRDIRKLGGLARLMPFTAVVGSVAAVSMAGLPPLVGFLGKETMLATAVYKLPTSLSIYLTIASVVTGAFLLAQSALLVWETFFGKKTDLHPHDPPAPMWVAPAVPVVLSVLLGVMGLGSDGPKAITDFLASAGQASYGGAVKVSLDLFPAINLPLGLSVVAILAGGVLFWARTAVRAFLSRFTISMADLYEQGLLWQQKASYYATRLQPGGLRTYVAVIVASMVALLFYFGRLIPTDLTLTSSAFTLQGTLAWLRLFALVTAVGASVASVLIRRDFFAIIALGVSGISVALLMVLEPAPDVALVQIVVDILAVVILMLALARLPRKQRREAAKAYTSSPIEEVRDVLVATASGIVVMLMTLSVLNSRAGSSALSEFFLANAKPLAGAKDVVGAIVVDFRAIDTLIEIAVFSIAALSIYMLLTYSAQKHGDRFKWKGRPLSRLKTLGIGGRTPSPFLRMITLAMLPITVVIGFIHMMYGHDQPGDGFTAGVIISLGIGLWYVIFGYEETQKRLSFLKPIPLIVTGILLALGVGTTTAFLNGAFLSPYKLDWFFLPDGFVMSSAFLFEVSICLTVLGSVGLMLRGEVAEEPEAVG